MRLRKTTALLGLALSLSFTSFAQAATTQQEITEEQAKQMFDKVDADKDGFVSKEEGSKFLFAQLKKQLQGKMDEEQIKAMVKKMVEGIFKKADTDMDGKLSFEEVKALKPQQP